MAIAGTLAVRVIADTGDAEKGIQRFRIELEQVKQSSDTAKAGMDGFGSSLARLSAGVLSIGAITLAIKDLVRTGLEMQALRNSFTAIAGSANLGAQQFAFVTETANRLGLGVKDLAETYRGLSAATRGTQAEGQLTKDLFLALTNASRTFGLSTDQVKNALLAFQQIISKGKVEAQELREQLGNALPGATQIAARAFGVTAAEFGKMQEKGIEAFEFTRKFIDQLKREAPAAADIAGKGIAQLGNEILALKDRIAQSGLLKFVDDVAAKGAQLLGKVRTESEESQRKLTLEMTRTLGGESPDKLAIEDQKVLKEVTAQRLEAEEKLARLRALGGDSPSLGSRMRIRGAEEELAAMKALEAETKKHLDQVKAAGATRGEMTEIDAQFEAQTKLAEGRAQADKKVKEQLDAGKKSTDELNKSSAITAEIYGKLNGELDEQVKYLEKRKALTEKALTEVTQTIIGRDPRLGAVAPELLTQKSALQEQFQADTDRIDAIKKQQQEIEAAKRKAEQDAEAAKRQAQQEIEQGAKAEVQRLREITSEEDREIETLRTLAGQYTTVKAVRDADTASMLKAQLATSQYADEAARLVQVIDEAQQAHEQFALIRDETTARAITFEAQQAAESSLDRYEQLLNLGPSKDAREYLKAKSDLGALQGTDLDERRLAVLKQMEPEYRKLRTVADEFADSFLNTLERVTSGGIKSFHEFADSILQDIIRIFNRQYLAPMTGKLFQQGIDAVLGYFGGGGNASTAAALGGSYAGESPYGSDIPGMEARASGGPIMPGKFYVVGERGPELLYAGSSGYVQSQRGMGGGVNVTVNVNSPRDANDVKRSAGEIRQAYARALQQAQRDA